MSPDHEIVLVRGGEGERLVAALREEHPSLEIVTDAASAAGEITVAAGRVHDDELASLPALDWVHSWAAGVEGDVGPQLRQSGITVTSSAGNGAIPLAEHALMLTLMLNRDAPRWLAAQRAGRWDRFTHAELHGLTMGIYGFGNVGRELATRARAFGMRVVALRRDPSRDTELVDEMFGPEGIHEFAALCDVLVVTAASTPETHGAIDASVLSALRPGASLVVVSRGGIVRDTDLLAALKSGPLAAAGLDAHTVEPLPEDSPFWTLPNVLVTPHNGATTPATAARGAEIFRANLRRRLSSRPLLNRVDVTALV
ncbi:phosphoglycerate dehydrogenase-like enzyme [Mycetocola sp. CAN_C7]|uniref:D-2-hydroxyacid dehydrogenase n=1 Tax=Mycetocola sp. CAN_C7 TaxID=2787724 RepID=UPI0018CBCEBE